MGTSNQYREHWNAKVYLHALDLDQPLTKSFPVDERFSNDLLINRLAGYHIGEHTPGYTLYIYRDVLFICDYAFPPGPKMRLNPFGPKAETLQRAERILFIINHSCLKTVCGYNNVCDFKDWLPDFKSAIGHS